MNALHSIPNTEIIEPRGGAPEVHDTTRAIEKKRFGSPPPALELVEGGLVSEPQHVRVRLETSLDVYFTHEQDPDELEDAVIEAVAELIPGLAAVHIGTIREASLSFDIDAEEISIEGRPS